MGLKVASEVTVRRKAIIREPRNDHSFYDHSVKIDFTIMANSEEDELYKQTFVAPLRSDFVTDEDYRRAVQEHEAQARGYARKLLTKVVTGWPADKKESGLEDANGEALAFSDEALAQLLELPYAVTGLVKAYREAVEGKGGQRGN
ncbi:hypothetical protein [Niveispirillum sp. BGYR6]|uniref:hypothetical protein n=1 Tax=Niveispirillum sp. BGYR6 TaxID=2971249 RepID=UPI0022B94FAC|nr:hypothetical protein [Niveispirillum sp. BGYR6]MDG5497420.1 hypothetical protein [Niveispirillum sp. BGYR6]